MSRTDGVDQKTVEETNRQLKILNSSTDKANKTMFLLNIILIILSVIMAISAVISVFKS